MQPVEEKTCRKDDAKKHGVHSHFELPFRDSVSKHQQADDPANAEEGCPDAELNNRPGQFRYCAVHVCPHGEKPESYRDALLAVISDPFFVGPVAFCAGLLSAAWAIQSLSGSLAA